MVGRFTKGEVTVANRIVWALLRDGRLRLSRSCCHRGMIPESDGLDSRSRISLERSVVDMDVMELIKVSCCCDIKEDISLEPRRLVKATLGHLTGRPWVVLRIFQWTRSSISDSVLDIVHSLHPYSMMGRECGVRSVGGDRV